MTLLSLLLFVSVFCLYRINKLNTVRSENKISSIQRENNDFKKVIGFMYQYDGKKLPDMMCMDDKGNKRLFSEFCSLQHNILVFNYSSFDCSDCIDKAMKKLSSEKIGTLFIVSDFVSISSMRYLKDTHGLNNAIFLKIESGAGFPESPSVFLVDNKLIIRRFLIINQNDIILEPYLKQL